MDTVLLVQLATVAEKLRALQRFQSLRHGNSALPSSGARTVSKREHLQFPL